MAAGRAVQGSVHRPLGVSLLALVQVWNGFLYLVLALVLLALSSKADEAGERQRSGLLLLLALVYLIMGIYTLWLARGYVKGYEWARRRGVSIAAFAIILLFVGIFFAKLSFLVPESPFWTIIGNAVIIWYLGRDKVKRFFASRSAALRR